MSEPTTLIPHLCCRNGVEAIEFYGKAFGAEPTVVMKMPDGRLMHGSLNIGGAMVYLCEESPEHGATSPLHLGGSPVVLHLQVPDCDAVFQRAVDAGCEVRMPLQDMFWGSRYGVLRDPYGHKWSVATTIRQVTPDEMRQAMASFSAGDA